MELAGILAAVTAVDTEDDGSLTIRRDGTVASLRTVQIADGLELISLTQVLAWDLPCDAQLSKHVAALAHSTLLGTVTLVERPGDLADVMLRYNFPFVGLSESALQTLVLMVLDAGVQVRRAL